MTHRKCTPTTRVEHLLLLLNILLLPLENYIPTVRGFSCTFLLFAISSIYIMTQRFRSIAYVWNHQVFLASYFLILMSLVLEAASPYASYQEPLRVAQMFVGAVVIATLCRDIRALKVCILGYILLGILMSVYLFLACYGTLQGATATDFNEASTIRGEMDDTLGMNLNAYPFFIAQGVAAALAIALMSRSAFTRYSLFGIIAVGFIVSFLPLSRSGTAAMLVTCMAVVLAYVRANRGASFQRFIRIIAVILGLGMCTLLWVPPAVFARLTLPSATPYEQSSDPRVRLYDAALAHLPEYWLVGVGVGNFWGPWGKQSQYQRNGRVLGTHNYFIQIMIYSGLPGLLSLISILYYAYKCLPKKYGASPLSLAVFGITVPLFLFMWVCSSFYAKNFSLGFGILVGTQHWIWSAGKTQLLGRTARKTLTESRIAL
jgi:O-Antigen ligase